MYLFLRQYINFLLNIFIYNFECDFFLSDSLMFSCDVLPPSFLFLSQLLPENLNDIICILQYIFLNYSFGYTCFTPLSRSLSGMDQNIYWSTVSNTSSILILNYTLLYIFPLFFLKNMSRICQGSFIRNENVLCYEDCF